MHAIDSTPSDSDFAVSAIESIRQRAPHCSVAMGLILGSGAGTLAEQIQDPLIIPYEDIPGMQPCRVEGHGGKLYLGVLQGVHVACFQGRNHLYEGHPWSVIRTPIRILKLLGARVLLQVSAVGSLREDVGAGSLVVIQDHINFQGCNPLTGMNNPSFGTRFPSLENAYDVALRRSLIQTAQELGIRLPEAVYLATLGPSFETPSEIRAFRTLGADVVGMSTVAETILARHCGLKVAAIGMVTNLAVGLSDCTVDHELTLAGAQRASGAVTELVIRSVASQPMLWQW